MRIRSQTAVVGLLACSILWSSSAAAQQRHIIDPAVMEEAIANQTLTDQANRDALFVMLDRSEVRELASRLGLSVTRAEAAVSTLSSAELADLATHARAADAQLVGGADTIVISVTTLLLILIVVLLIAR